MRTSGTLTLRDVLSQLSPIQARRVLGPSADRLLTAGGRHSIDIESQVTLDEELLRLQIDASAVAVRLSGDRRKPLAVTCSTCGTPCEHAGAALSLVLEEKLALGLSTPPADELPLELLSEEQLVERALAERAERARSERMTLTPLDGRDLWSDYAVTNAASGRTYRVALRGWERGESYCSCPDFRTNTLGTCKHLVFALKAVKRRFPAATLKKPYRRTRITLHVRYGTEAQLRLLLPDSLEANAERIAAPLRERPVDDVDDLLARIKRLEGLGIPVHITPDAEEMMSGLLVREKIAAKMREIRKDPRSHPLRTQLLKVQLLPYQLEGIAFALAAGRSIIADDMGLGKTIQGIGTAELLAREVGISRVLVICPASLKSQWAAEIERATGRSWQVVLGGAAERARLYRTDSFFTICNYEQALRDILAIESARWDLIILDEGQRIKNWESKTSRVIKGLVSPWALVLSGTPLENRLDELYSVVQFINARQLGPAFRFFHRHRVVDEKGKVLGYRNLDELRRLLQPLLLRRTRAMVLRQLPRRTTEILRIAPSAEQADLHDSHKRVVSTIVAKRYISEMDLLRLQKALLMCRMAADSTFLVDKNPPGYSTKLAELEGLLEQLLGEPDRKIIIFSEWTTMLDLIEPLLAGRTESVRLDGSVPQAKRGALVHRFQHDPSCAAFLATNAGATGLNLQAANTVINVDLPWNPAVLEQRIARAHRMGQRRPVHAYLLVTEGTIEESLLSTLAAKQDLALAALDSESTASEVALSGGIDELKRRLEVLIGARPAAPIDESDRERVRADADAAAKKESVARAAGTLMGAAFSFVGELLGGAAEPDAGAGGAGSAQRERLKALLAQCMERTEDGGWRMSVRFSDSGALEAMADALSRLAASSAPGK